MQAQSELSLGPQPDAAGLATNISAEIDTEQQIHRESMSIQRYDVNQSMDEGKSETTFDR